MLTNKKLSHLIEAKDFNEVINFSKQLKKLIVITRGEKGAVAIQGEEIIETGIKKILKFWILQVLVIFLLLDFYTDILINYQLKKV